MSKDIAMDDFGINEMLEMQKALQESIKINGNQFVLTVEKISCYG